MLGDGLTGKDKKTANLQLVKDTNMTLIFNLIYKNRPVSRAELAKRTKLSPTTVSSLVDELIKRGVVYEKGAGETGTSGRKPIMLDINARGGVVVSIELVENGMACYLYDLACTLVGEQKYVLNDFGCIGEKLICATHDILVANGIYEEKLMGIAVGVPGLIDYKTNHVISSTVVPLDRDNHFYKQLTERYPAVPIILENESCLCAYAEKEYGLEEDTGNLVFIDVNVGIGSGIIIGGKVYRGSFGLAGEIGHISIDMNGPRCKCGNRGCLEIMASVPAIVQSVMFALMSGRDTSINSMVNHDLNRIDADIVRKAAEENDTLALEVMDIIAMRLAFGINNVINLFNPQVVVIGGEIMKLGDVFLQKIKECLETIALKPNIPQVDVRYSALGVNATAKGGARYILDNIFHTPGLASEGAVIV